MVIQTISKTYRVIRTLSGSSRTEAYLCRDNQTVSDERYLLQGLTGSGLSRKIVPYFMELSSRREAGDFLDCFTNRGSLWLVFCYFNYKTLDEKMEEPFLLAERLEASRTLMERMVAQNLPFYLQYEALNLDNLTVSDTCEVFYNYLLREPELLNGCGMDEVCVRLAEFFERLFAVELEEEMSGEMKTFVSGLREKRYPGYIAVYRDYRALYDVIAMQQSEGLLRPKGWLLRMWEKFKLFLKKLWRFLYVALIIGLVAYLIYLYVKPKDMPASRIEFNQIGTLNLKNGGAAESAQGTEAVQSTDTTQSTVFAETMENGDNPE